MRQMIDVCLRGGTPLSSALPSREGTYTVSKKVSVLGRVGT